MPYNREEKDKKNTKMPTIADALVKSEPHIPASVSEDLGKDNAEFLAMERIKEFKKSVSETHFSLEEQDMVKHATREELESIVERLVKYATREQLEYLVEFMQSDSPIINDVLQEIYKSIRSKKLDYEEMLEDVPTYHEFSYNYNHQPDHDEFLEGVLDDIERTIKPYVEIKLLKPITNGDLLGTLLLMEILSAFEEIAPLDRDWVEVLRRSEIEGISRITFYPDLMISFWGSIYNVQRIFVNSDSIRFRKIPFDFGTKSDVFEAVSYSLENGEQEILFPAISLKSYGIEAKVTLHVEPEIEYITENGVIDIIREETTLCRIQKIQDINAPIPGTKSDSSPDPGDL